MMVAGENDSLTFIIHAVVDFIEKDRDKIAAAYFGMIVSVWAGMFAYFA